MVEEQKKFKQSGVRSQETEDKFNVQRSMFNVQEDKKDISNTDTNANTEDRARGQGLGAEDKLNVQGSMFNVMEKGNLSDNKTITKDVARGDRPGAIGEILYVKWIKRLFIAFLAFIGLQIIPLPIALVKILSPKKIEVLGKLMDELPGFTSLSWVPFETLVFGLVALIYGLFFLVLSRIQLRKREMVSVLNALLLSASAQVVFGLLKLAGGNTMFYLFFYPVEKSDISRFLTGTLGNANHFAFFLEMALALALGLFFYRLRFLQPGVSWKEKILSIADENRIMVVYFLGIALLGAGILLTGSRAGIVTMLLVFALFTQLLIYLRVSRRFRRKIIWILAVISVVVLYAGVQNTIDEFKRSEITEAGRFTRWPNTFEMFRDYPAFGTGMATYRYAYYLYDQGAGKWSTHAHNDILEILAEGGIPGGIIFFLLAGAIILSIVKTWSQRHHPDVRILGAGIVTAIFAAVFHSIFDFSLRIPSNMLVFVLILVLGMKVVGYKRSAT